MPSPGVAPEPAPRSARLALTATAGAGEHADDLVADLLRVGVEVEQDAGGDALVLAHEAEQDVLGADVVVAEAQRLAQGQLEHLLGARRERDLPGGDLLAGADDPHDLRAHALDGDVEALEHARRKALLLAQQPEQDVLGADVVVLERPRLLLRKNDHLPGPFCESLEHGVVPSSRAVPQALFDPGYASWGVYQPATRAPPGQSRIAGNSTTSRIDSRPVSSITRRSIPSPTPPVGGMPCSSAWTNSSS